jgi:8-oxo-dGTP pyrophosphatase MutT (NUDIX family)
VIAYRLKRPDEPDTEAPQLEILLITSRKRKRWIIPKGIIEPGLSPQASAAKEAFEEAGVRGKIADQALGVYTHDKWNGTCTIEVFPLEVTSVVDDWPEGDVREREWMSLDKALQHLQEAPLKAMLRKLAQIVSCEVPDSE